MTGLLAKSELAVIAVVVPIPVMVVVIAISAIIPLIALAVIALPVALIVPLAILIAPPGVVLIPAIFAFRIQLATAVIFRRRFIPASLSSVKLLG